jgi:hypothetical protein
MDAIKKSCENHHHVEEEERKYYQFSQFETNKDKQDLIIVNHQKIQCIVLGES